MTQSDVARDVHVSKAAVSQWELDFAIPQGESLIRLAERLGTTPSALLWHGKSATTIPLNEARLCMAIACLEDELGNRYLRLPPPKKAKLLSFLYDKGEPIAKNDLDALLRLVE